jgi:hypothetical protein
MKAEREKRWDWKTEYRSIVKWRKKVPKNSIKESGAGIKRVYASIGKMV